MSEVLQYIEIFDVRYGDLKGNSVDVYEAVKEYEVGL